MGRRKKVTNEFDPSDFLSSGSSTLNCALTDSPYCGFRKGKCYHIVGDSQSGKTLFTMGLFSEASRDSEFDDYRFIHNNTEDGMLFDVEKYFGSSVVDRLEAPGYDDDGMPVPTTYLEDFYTNLKEELKKGPCIYVADSVDAMISRQEEQKEEKQNKQAKSGQAVKGEMSDGKAKIHSSRLRRIIPRLRDTGSILFLVSQTRDNLGQSFAEKTVSGGRALKFYSTCQIWMSSVKTLTKTVKDKKRKVGNTVRFDIRKNRTTDYVGPMECPLLSGYGFDDIGGCVDFLCENSYWKNSNGKILAKEFVGEKVSREKLIRTIEQKKNGLVDLQELVGSVWNEIRESLKPKRKSKYE